MGRNNAAAPEEVVTAPEQTTTETAAVTEESGQLTNAAIDAEARSMKEILNARPKVKIKLLDREAAKSGAQPEPYPVGINGYVFRIPWNVPVEVPDRVAEILESQGLI